MTIDEKITKSKLLILNINLIESKVKELIRESHPERFRLLLNYGIEIAILKSQFLTLSSQPTQ